MFKKKKSSRVLHGILKPLLTQSKPLKYSSFQKKKTEKERKKKPMLFQEMKLRVKTSKLDPIIKTCRIEIGKHVSRIIKRIELKTDRREILT